MSAGWDLSNASVVKLCRFASAAGLTPDDLVDEALALWVGKNCGAGARSPRADADAPSEGPDDDDDEEEEEEGRRWADLTGAIFQHLYGEMMMRARSSSSSSSSSMIGRARLACRSWAAGLAANCTELRPATETHTPRCIQRPFGELFPNLRTLDLTLHPYFGRRAEDLDALQGLSRLRSLSLKWWGELSPEQVARVSSALPALAECSVALKTRVLPGTLRALGALRVGALSLEWCIPGSDGAPSSSSSSPEEDVQLLMALGDRLASLSVHSSSGYFEEEADSVPPLCARLGLLAPLTALQSLVLARQSVGDEHIAGLAGLTGLTRLDLRDCCNVSERGLEPLSRLSRLRFLNLSAPGYGGPAGDRGLEALRPLRALRALDLTGRAGEATDAGLQALEGMTGLTSLALTELRRVSHRGLESIARLTRLRFLNLELCGAPHGFSALESLTDLRALGLSTCAGLTDGDLLALCVAMTKLRAIDLSFTGVEQFGCHALGLCHDLAAASLEGTSITDDSILSLAGLNQLKNLNLQSCRNLSLGVGALAPLCGLSEIAIYLGTHTDSVRADAIRRLIPSCRIDREPVSFSIEDYFEDAVN